MHGDERKKCRVGQPEFLSAINDTKTCHENTICYCNGFVLVWTIHWTNCETTTEQYRLPCAMDPRQLPMRLPDPLPAGYGTKPG